MLSKNHNLKQESYSVIRLVRQNNLGACYEAVDNRVKKNILLWEFFTESNRTVNPNKLEFQKNAFASEAKILIGIKHHCILQVYDYFSEGDHHYLTTEPTIGKNFGELFKEKPEIFTTQNVIRWGNLLLDALESLQFQTPPLVHGNIKPENIFLTADGKLKLLPFGISAYPNISRDGFMRHSSFDAANLHYSPLEQIWTGLDPASQKVILNDYDEKSESILEQPENSQSDIYSLGATLYRLFTKQLPIDPLERSIDILEGKADPLKSPHVLNSQIPLQISEALVKSLQIRRENRFETASQFRRFFREEMAKWETPRKVAVVKPDNEDLLDLGIAATKHFKTEKVVTTAPPNPGIKGAKDIQTVAVKPPVGKIEKPSNPIEQNPPSIPTAEAFELAQTTALKVEKEDSFLEKAPVAEKTFEPNKISQKQAVARPTDKLYTADVKVLNEVESETRTETPSEPVKTVESPKTIPTTDYATANNSTLFAEPPQQTGGFRKMAMAAAVLALLGGAGWGVFSVMKPKSVEANQAVSVEASQPQTFVKENAPAASTTPAFTENSASPTIAATPEIAETVSETQERQAMSVVSPETRNRGLSAAPRIPKQTPTPPKIATAPKKSVTVDDIINDN